MSEPTTPVPADVPVCPRHPDRVSYVRCQRCGRPVCPECQRPAAVGVHCVDCVREANQSTPQARTAFGAPLRRGAPVVTYTLIGINALVFLLEQVLGRSWTLGLALRPSTAVAEPWTFLTSAFLHDGLLHIGFNMYALWILGQFLEPALGRARYLTLYFVSALGGGVMVVLLADPNASSWITSVLGASGAVFGLFGAVFVVLRRLGRDATGIVTVLVLNAVLAIALPYISWQAHVGGLVTGFLLGLAYAYVPRSWRSVTAFAAPAVLVVLLVGLAAAKLAAAG
jgi:membrane associated rhomboid family serine protease